MQERFHLKEQSLDERADQIGVAFVNQKTGTEVSCGSALNVTFIQCLLQFYLLFGWV